MWLAERLARAVTGRDTLTQHNSGVAEVSHLIPASTADAERHILRIRDSKGVGHPTGHSKDQQGIVKLLANNMYRRPSHFLWELIQNVDDNNYVAHEPTLTITYKNRVLRFDSNETGFTMEDVEAICSMGNSSKTRNPSSRIGRKGIGFKSVFKVAESVHIASGFYSFQFDARRSLGMMIPVWSPFPEERMPGWTSLLFQLSPGCDVNEILHELETLDSRSILFLRRLRRVHVRIVYEGIDGREFNSDFTRPHITCKPGELQTLHLSDTEQSPLVLYRHGISGLPSTDPGVRNEQSDIFLVFPQPRTLSSNTTCFTFAFLPIRDYGFRFVFHADFDLVANREDVDLSSARNQALLRDLSKAFLGAVDSLNSGQLRYTWPYYLPFPTTDSFFEPLPRGIINLLSQTPVLESGTGHLMAPEKLTWVPDLYTDHHGRPLIPQEYSTLFYLSQHYHADLREQIKQLGVNVLSETQFINELSFLITNKTNNFRSMADSWHAKICKVLCDLLENNMGDILKLEIIPLRDGRWVSAQSEGLVFPLNNDDLFIPKGLGLAEIDPQAARNPHRRRLAERLGATRVEKADVCERILEAHQVRSSNDVKDTSHLVLISHAQFLYRAGWIAGRTKPDLWLVAENLRPCRASRIYVRSNDPFSAGQLLAAHKHPFVFLHEEDSSPLANYPNWIDWMQLNLGVSVFPRLVDFSGHDDVNFVLSADFRLLAGQSESNEWLELLCRRWKHYRYYLVDDAEAGSEVMPLAESEEAALKASRQRLRSELATMTVLCIDGNISPSLNMTFLPRKSVLSGLDALCPSSEKPGSYILADIPDPEDVVWNVLKYFGVQISLNADAYIKRLRQLQHEDATRDEASRLYQHLHVSLADENGGYAREAFSKLKLLFLPKGNSVSVPVWLSTDDCVWDGPDCLERTPRIIQHYPELESFFRDALRIPNATLKTLVNEARRIIPSDSLVHIQQVLIATSGLIQPKAWKDNREAGILGLKSLNIFPIWLGESGGRFDQLRSAIPSLVKDDWYIADRPHLLASFEGRVPLLALSLPNLQALSNLIQLLQLEERMLSKLAIKVSNIETDSAHSVVHTTNLRAKAHHIARLLPNNTTIPERQALLSQLNHIHVSELEGFEFGWEIKGTGQRGRTEAGAVALHLHPDMLDVYMSSEEAAIGFSSLELLEELRLWLKIADGERTSLLHHVLTEKNVERIEASFRRRGVPEDVPEWEDIANAMKQAISMCPRCASITLYSATTAGEMSGDDYETQKSYAQQNPSKAARYHKSPENPKHRGGVRPVAELYKEYLESREPAANHTFHAIKDGIIALRSSPITFGGKKDGDLQFVGEHLVSEYLSRSLGEGYVPSQHWKSPLRVGAGHPPSDKDAKAAATFVIKDVGEKLRGRLFELDDPRLKMLVGEVTFHMCVCVTEGSLNTPFRLQGPHAQLAQDLALTNTKPVDEVFVLLRVYNATTHCRVAIFIDPWALRTKGLLSIVPYGGWQCTLDTLGAPGPSHLNLDATHTHLEPYNCYKYLSLQPNHIRVLYLHPHKGQREAPLEASIQHVALSSEPNFSALSYVWGNAETVEVLQTSEGSIPITRSLATALRRIRHEKSHVSIWADAVCIYQHNAVEKSAQIRLMQQIYQQADMVLAWIGELDSHSSSAFQFLRQLRDGGGVKAKLPENDDPVWDSLNMLLSREWFSRIWIVQELVLGSKVEMLCGNESILWEDFFESIVIAWEHRSDALPNAEAALAMGFARRHLKLTQHKLGFFQLLESFSHTKATKFEDKMFALLGIASDVAEEEFDPDYGSGVQAVAQRYAVKFVEKGMVLDLLYRSGMGRLPGSATPSSAAFTSSSWIPAFTSSPFPETIANWNTGTARYFAGHRGVPEASVRIADTVARGTAHRPVLAVRGAIIDSLAGTAALRVATDSFASFTAANEDLERFFAFLLEYPTGESLETVRLMLVVGGATGPCSSNLTLRRSHWTVAQVGDAAPNIPDGCMWPANLKDEIFCARQGGNVAIYTDRPRSSLETVAAYWRTAAAFTKRIPKAKLCHTAKGYAGLVPGNARAGDKIYLLRGGAVPFVLRAGRVPGQYWLVGECYIHGIMYGEALGCEEAREPGTVCLV